jgi:hypothetical protein
LSGTINVLVKDKETHQQSVITYKAFRDTSYRFDLIGQVDDQGNLMESDPNLQPQHQRKVVEKKAAVVDAGGKTPQIVIDAMLEEAKKIAEDIAVKNFNAPHPNDGADFNPEGLDSIIESAPEPAQQPIKERKKPGPKPKNKPE